MAVSLDKWEEEEQTYWETSQGSVNRIRNMKRAEMHKNDNIYMF